LGKPGPGDGTVLAAAGAGEGELGLHVGVVGGGMVGRVHLEALREHPAVSAISIADSDPRALRAASGGARSARAETDVRMLLDDASIDVIDICLPHDMHYPVALEAFSAGKHVITDKPISNTLAEADAMIAAAESAGRRFYVALNQRFLPVHEHVKRLLEDGFVGAPVLATLTVAGSELARMRIPGHWKGTVGRAGGGALADSGTHIVDLMHHWFGPPRSVTCRLVRHVVEAVNKADDTAALIMEYPGLTASLAVTYAAGGQPWSETRDLWSETGSIHVRLEAEQPLTLWKDGQQVHRDVAHDATWWPYSVRLGLAHALDSLASDGAFAVTPHDARATLRTIRAAYHAAATGRRVMLEEYQETLP
jgi:UDP-N-acetyl-2-amino-2-deoxyglucuronate dehydrogenase